MVAGAMRRPYNARAGKKMTYQIFASFFMLLSVITGATGHSVKNAEILTLRSAATQCLEYEPKVVSLCLNQSARDRYSTARVSKRLTYWTAACLRARYCTGVPMLSVSIKERI